MASNNQAKKAPDTQPGNEKDTESALTFRPTISANTKNKFLPNDEVWLTEPGGITVRGPYLIEKLSSPGRYILCDMNGSTIENGKSFEENMLSFV